MSDFSRALLRWYDTFGRKTLPWSTPRTPYRVWISEIMLQQTQVATVIPYFKRFIKRFSSIKQLALAPEEAVLTHWAGLGYYARARNLHKAAKQLHHDYHGRMPSDVEKLQTLPGIGRSTAGAITTLAFEQRAAILDGNVKRVLTRYANIEGWPDDKQVQIHLWTLAESLLPKNRFGDYTQAFMDLGATLCTRKSPNCTACPVKKHCQAYQHGLQDELPTPRPKKKLPHKQTFWSILQYKNEVLCIKRPPSGIWGSLWCFPDFDSQEAVDDFSKQFDADIKQLSAFEHTFTHFKLNIQPICIHLSNKPLDLPESWTNLWYDLSQFDALAVPKPVKSVLQQLQRRKEIA